ncbi:Ddx49-A-prov protein [Aphelenchoides avenae]|nr:Ddx49-A-prov protein [Aphelenchus avenae]
MAPSAAKKLRTARLPKKAQLEETDSDEGVEHSTEQSSGAESDEDLSEASEQSMDDEEEIEDEEDFEDEEEPATSDEEVEAPEIPATAEKEEPLEADAGSTATQTFAELGIGKWLTKQLDELNLRRPTPLNCIPRILAGSDVLGCAKTGTGKTLAFALPILQKLAVDPYGIFALVLTPTRELAFQIAEQLTALGRPIGIQLAISVGGRHQMAQAQDLARRPHIVVATPGRLADHIESEPDGFAQLLKSIQFLVLDEADRLLDGQYALQLKTIFGALPKQRQTLLFSATITSALSKLHQLSVSKPYFFEEKDEVKTADRLVQQYVLCPRSVKDAYLVYVVKNFYLRRETSSVLVFAQTTYECQALAIMFKALGFEVGSLHSDILQRQRLASLTRFRSGKIRILICTDVAARGLDIPHVDLVVNHNVPRSPKEYVHRVGRSARAGRFGAAVTFVTQHDLLLLQAIEEAIGKKHEQLKVSHKKVTRDVAQVLMTKREAEIKLERQHFGERKEIFKRKELAMAGYDEEQIEAYIKERRMRKEKWRNPVLKRAKEEDLPTPEEEQAKEETPTKRKRKTAKKVKRAAVPSTSSQQIA